MRASICRHKFHIMIIAVTISDYISSYKGRRPLFFFLGGAIFRNGVTNSPEFSLRGKARSKIDRRWEKNP